MRLLLDVSASQGYAPRDISKLDYARYLTASLAYLCTRQGDRVGLACFSDRIHSSIPARGGERHLQTILVALERIEARGRTHIGENLLRQAAQWKRRGMILLISDLYDNREEITEAVMRVRRVGHDVIVFHLMDRAERLLEKRGTYEFRDLETGETLLADADRVRREYTERVEETRAFFRREFERTGADYVELDPSEPLDKALAIYLRRRKAEKSK